MDLSRKTINEMARELRRNTTPSEKKLWEVLRKRRLQGYRFVRQKPLVYWQENEKRYFYIADFYCPELKLVVELDGTIHRFQLDYDYQRDLVLKKLKLNVLRIKNEELSEMENVKEKILSSTL